MGGEPRPGRSTGPSWRILAAIVCSLAGIAAVLVAWQQPGFPGIPPQPVDPSVWVVNDGLLLVGRINTGIGELDSAAQLRGASDVLQDPMQQAAGSVLVVDQAKHEMQVLDTATVTFGARVSIPDDAAVQWRGGTLAVADRTDGRLWVGDGAAIGSVDARTVDPQATLGPLPVVAVSTEGTVFAIAAGSSTLLRAEPGKEPVTSTLPVGPLSLGQTGPGTGLTSPDPAGDLQLSTVGQIPVVLDRADSSLRIDGRRIMLPAAADAVLQQPGPAAAEVVIATTEGLLGVALADGSVRTITRVGGTPLAPAVDGGCSYGAWLPAVPGAAVRAVAQCAEAVPAAPIELTGSNDVDGSAPPVFRQRGAAVVLGDSATGRSWVATDHYREVDNWRDVAPPDPTVDDTVTVDDQTTSPDDRPRLPPDCTAVPVGQPSAADDEFGVRAGRATVLRVLDNDPSVDCTSVVIDSVSPLPASLGTVVIVAGGSAIQVTVPDTATGRLPAIEYRVGNGAGAGATAKALVNVMPVEVTARPEPIRRSFVATEVNGTASYNVLDDFVSPTGDDLFLLSATTESTDVLSFRPDGTISYRNTGTGAGTDSVVRFVVSDGVEVGTGTLTVAIESTGSTTPVVYPLSSTAVVGSAALAHPLRSVVSAATDPVTISTVQPEPGSEAATARLDPQDGSVAITAADPGTYYFTFEASTGGRAITGVLRADFVPPNDASRSVVPMTDVAYLAPGKQVVIDPLANDTDPDGRGLAVREVDVPSGSPITAAVVDLHLVQVSAGRVPRQPVMVGYAVFDGTTTQVGQIRIVPVPAAKRIPPPLASPITATVRAGDAVTIPVARFATSQDGSPVTAELDAEQLAGLPGRAFSTGNTIRYLAPADGPLGPVSFSYRAVAGTSTPLQPVQSVSTVTITVTSGDPARNSPPNTPQPVTARVFVGGSISISVPLAGTDPDGDWVVLSSLEQPDQPLGDIAVAGPETLSYTAFAAAGVDRIRYLATDPSGLSVAGEITVMVAEPGASARPPVAPDLSVSVRPGASIRIDPLSVVVDPGGQRVVLAAPAFTASAGLQVQVDQQSLIVTAPPEPTVATMRYAVINAKGLSASGSVKVTVSADAPMPAPIADDIFVRPADLAANNQTVDVDVAGAVTNRSGRRDELAVTVDPLSAGQARMTGPQRIRVSVAAFRQIVAYRVTDAYGQTATAFLVVPPQQQLVGPQLIAGAGPIRLNAGRSVDAAIGDYVTVGGGKEPTIAGSPAPRATQGSAIRTSPTTLTLSAPSSAGGQGAVYVPIDDGAGAVVVLGLPMVIEPRLVPPPRLDSTEAQIEAGTSGSVDLAALTTTFDEQQAASISYAAGSGEAGVQTAQDGSVITVSVRPDVPRGTQVAVPIQVVDGDGRDGKAVLSVTVTGSRKPLATVVDQQIDQGRAGVEVAADLLTGSSDPIGLGLTVGNLSVVEGAGGIAAGPVLTGSTVRLTPAAGYVGSIVVAAEVGDGTRDPDRVVTVNLRVAIQDRPSAPGVPTVIDGTLTASSVQLAWEPAEANGAAIETYTVTGSGVAQDCPGPESSCLISGLTAGRPYVFVVTARNAVGDSAPSAPSPAIVPDAAPSASPAPQVQYVSRGRLLVSWITPSGDFTPVTGMSLQVLQNETVVEVRDPVSSPTSFDGLDAAAGYRFQVRATNREGTGDWSAASEAVVPSGVPSEPSNLQARFRLDAQQRGVAVSWGPPADTGGEPVQGYTLYRDNVEIASGGGDFRSQFVVVDGNAPMTFSVIARNSRGKGPPAVGLPVSPFGRPSTVPGLTVRPADGALQASWSPAASPGRPIQHYDYRLNGGGWVPAGSGTTTNIPDLVNGSTYAVEVRACNDATDFGEDVRCGPPSDPASGTPFGGLVDPTVTAKLTGPGGSSVTVIWTIPADGNGRRISSRSVQISGVDAVDPAAGTWTGDVGYGTTVSVTVQYCVQGPDECSTKAGAQVSTPVSLSVIGPAPLTGTCGVPDRSTGGGPWRTAADCAPGVWVAAGTSVVVLCQATGALFPASPDATKNDNRWYRATDNSWFRVPAFAPTTPTVPPC